MIPLRYTFQSYSDRFVDIDNTSIFGVAFPNTAAGFAAAIYMCFYNALLLASKFPTLYERFFKVRLNSSSSGSMKKIPRNCQSLSSFGFSMAHFCFALRFHASDICFHISGHTLSGLEVVCFLVGPPPGPCLSVRWPFVQSNESCETCPCI